MYAYHCRVYVLFRSTHTIISARTMRNGTDEVCSLLPCVPLKRKHNYHARLAIRLVRHLLDDILLHTNNKYLPISLRLIGAAAADNRNIHSHDSNKNHQLTDNIVVRACACLRLHAENRCRTFPARARLLFALPLFLPILSQPPSQFPQQPSELAHDFALAVSSNSIHIFYTRESTQTRTNRHWQTTCKRSQRAHIAITRSTSGTVLCD